MSNSKVSITGKQLLIVFFMGLAFAVVYATPFVQYVFYDDLAGALHATNTQLGFLIAIFGIGNLLAPFGGALSDKFNTKKVYLLGMFITCALNFLLAMNMSYTFAIFIWAGLAVAGLILYFPAHTKLVRLVGDEESQGTIFGFTEAGCGLASVIINFIALGLYAKVAVGAMGGVAGLKAVIISYGAVGLIATIALVFLLPDPEKAGKGQDGGDSGQETKLSMKEWAGVFKDPRTWFAGIAVFATYSTYQTLSYFTPYFTNVLGATVVGSGAIAIIRTYGIRIVGAPLGGYMGDRIHSVSSVIATVLACGAVITLIFMFMPAGVPSVLLTVMTLMIGFMVHIARGAMFAVPSEVKIPLSAPSDSARICFRQPCTAIGWTPAATPDIQGFLFTSSRLWWSESSMAWLLLYIRRNMWLRAWFRWKAELRLLRRSEGIVRKKKRMSCRGIVGGSFLCGGWEAGEVA